MGRAGYDVAVVGSGPSGSVAALVLARGGARVALVDKAAFPRDKACGDLVGPRGVQLLADLGLKPDGPHGAPLPHLLVGDMVVVGPTGGRAMLRARAGSTYPGHGWATPRKTFDAWLRQAALEAGAEPITARVAGVSEAGVHLDDPLAGAPPTASRITNDRLIAANVVVGADGANSVVASSAGLLDPDRVLWGFAIRTYLDQTVEVPVITFWDPTPGRGFPGYGWVFPVTDGRANVGLGVGAGADRRRGAQANRQFEAFLSHLRETGLLRQGPARAPRLGGWLKMGMVGTTPTNGNVILVGDAAGLVNPLQGEGIADGMATGRAAAEAILAGPASAANRYRRHLQDRYLSYQAATASLHATVLERPKVVSAIGRCLTAPGVGTAVGGAWALYWNDLAEGAARGPDGALAKMVAAGLRSATARGRSRRWLSAALAESA